MQVRAIIDTFRAVGQRSAHERHLSGVLAHERIRGEHVDRHREIEIDDIAIMPCAGQIQVSVSDDAGDVVAAAHGDRIGSGFATGPSGQTEGDRENRVLGCIGSRIACIKAHRDGSLAGPGHIGHDVKAHIGAGKPGMDAAAHIQMHIQGG